MLRLSGATGEGVGEEDVVGDCVGEGEKGGVELSVGLSGIVGEGEGVSNDVTVLLGVGEAEGEGWMQDKTVTSPSSAYRFPPLAHMYLALLTPPLLLQQLELYVPPRRPKRRWPFEHVL